MSWRFVASTIAGEAVDSSIFYPLAFYDFGHHAERSRRDAHDLAICGEDACRDLSSCRLTVRIVTALKRAENEDYYDRTTDFNPFKSAHA